MATDQRTLIPDAACGALNLGEAVLPADTTVGGFRIRSALHEGGMAVLYDVEAAGASDAPASPPPSRC